MATWACVQTVQAYAAGSAQFITSLAVSGPTLVGGSFSDPHLHTEEYEARVWDLETLEPLHTLRQPACGRLRVCSGERWGRSVGGGRDGRGGVGAEWLIFGGVAALSPLARGTAASCAARPGSRPGVAPPSGERQPNPPRSPRVRHCPGDSAPPAERGLPLDGGGGWLGVRRAEWVRPAPLASYPESQERA
jgi:hypothetical protein